MRREFGLIIHLTNLDRNSTQVEERQRQLLIDLENEKLAATMDQGQLLLNNLKELRKRRANLLSVFPIDKETLQELDENIKLLQDELEAITSARFGQHHVAATLEAQRPDELPRPGETTHAGVQYELESEPKGQLAD
jgi:cell division FtsZ-interacting protein ZapD